MVVSDELGLAKNKAWVLFEVVATTISIRIPSGHNKGKSHDPI